MRKFAVISLILTGLVLCLNASAQFKEEAFTQTYNDGKSDGKDSTDVLFSFKDFFRGLGHKQELKVGQTFAGSMVFIGSGQIYNKQYWKLPIVYGGIGTGIGLGIHFNNRYKASGLNSDKTASTLSFIGAGLFYWGSLMDGVICFKPDKFPHPGKATIYSILLPGLGQIYNREYWKIPIYIGGLAASYYFFETNAVNYKRYHDIYNESMAPDYKGPITSDVALYYRDLYRRYRDYSILAMGIVYLLQIIDANVFSYMHDFNMDDDLAIRITPTVIAPDSHLAMQQPAVGLNFGLRF